MKVPEGVLINIDNIKKYRPNQVVIITTGSQGEPMSALTRMAFSDHRKVEVTKDDLIIISATPIPGNEKSVSNVVNEITCGSTRFGTRLSRGIKTYSCTYKAEILYSCTRRTPPSCSSQGTCAKSRYTGKEQFCTFKRSGA